MSETIQEALADESKENCPLEETSIHHLLSISKNPMVKDMTTEQLNAYITRIRTVATSPQTMSSVLTSESRKKRPMTEAQRKRKELIDSI